MPEFFRLNRRCRWGLVGVLSALGAVLLPTQAQVSPVVAQTSRLGEWFNHIQQYALQYRSNLLAFLISLAYAAIATLLFRLSLRLLRRYYARLYKQICRLQRRWLPAIRIQSLELVSSQSMAKGLNLVARGLRLALVALLAYLYIPFLLNLSPWTRQLGELLFTALLSGISSITLGILGYIPNLIIVLLIVVVAYYLIKFIHKIFNEVEKGRLTIPGFYPVWANPTANLLSVIVVAFAAVLAFPYLPGGNSPALQGVSLFAGVLLSLGSTAVISNLVSGIVLIYTRAFSQGDRVTIGEVTGDVVEETLLVTRIMTTKNKMVTIPNGIRAISFSREPKDARVLS